MGICIGSSALPHLSVLQPTPYVRSLINYKMVPSLMVPFHPRMVPSLAQSLTDLPCILAQVHLSFPRHKLRIRHLLSETTIARTPLLHPCHTVYMVACSLHSHWQDPPLIRTRRSSSPSRSDLPPCMPSKKSPNRWPRIGWGSSCIPQSSPTSITVLSQTDALASPQHIPHARRERESQG